jgi:hypothetical protein
VGPDHWGGLSPNFTECAVGTNQSPIDIATARAVYNPALQPLHRDYTVANGTLVDNVVNLAVCCLCFPNRNLLLYYLNKTVLQIKPASVVIWYDLKILSINACSCGSTPAAGT